MAENKTSSGQEEHADDPDRDLQEGFQSRQPIRDTIGRSGKGSLNGSRVSPHRAEDWEDKGKFGQHGLGDGDWQDDEE